MNKKIINSELKRVSEQIISKYNPEKIILFGSLARGKTTKNSDIDLLVIKDTPEDKIRRTQRLSSLVDRKIAIDPIILTPKELKERLAIGDMFIKKIITQGKVLYE